MMRNTESKVIATGIVSYLYCLILVIAYFPLYVKAGVRDYNDAMVVFDAMILVGLPAIGTTANLFIIYYISIILG